MSQLKEDMLVGIFALLGVQVPFLIIFFIVWAAGYI